MRRKDIAGIGYITYPDKWCFAYNPQLVTIEAPDYRAMTICVTDVRKPTSIYTLDIALFDGHAVADISEALQAITACDMSQRWRYVHVSVKALNVSLASFHLYSLYGHIETGQYFSSMGDFVYDTSKAYFKRRVVWFNKYPFSVSLFRRSASEPVTCTVNGGTENNVVSADINIFDVPISDIYAPEHRGLRLKHIKSASSFSVFDDTFDYTFREQYGEMLTEIVDILNVSFTEGYYLRWIDTFGYIQYYLFTLSDVNVKNTNSNYTKDVLSQFTGYRPISTGVTETIKCCAMNLPEDIYRYVSTISDANVIELYDKGKWLPVNIVSSGKISTRDILNDYEITIEMKHNTQKL